jgi:hypothetical protein
MEGSTVLSTIFADHSWHLVGLKEIRRTELCSTANTNIGETGSKN